MIKALLVCSTDRNPAVLWTQFLKEEGDPVKKSTMSRCLFTVPMETFSP